MTNRATVRDGGERFKDRIEAGIIVVVADPRLEEVAENVESLGAARATLHER
jgi:hypothetical protein